jgi:hypothetical protein
MMIRNLGISMLVIAGCWFAAAVANAQGLQVPKTAPAGQDLRISGVNGTAYVFGPATAFKTSASGELVITGDQLRAAGRYTVVAGGNSGSFYVVAGEPANTAFLARPSRVPAAKPGVISGTAFVLDKYNNLVTQPTPVKFDLAVPGTPAETRSETSKLGVAYVRMDSGKKSGAAQFVVQAGDTQVRRVVQQTASDPCNIRMKAEPSKNGVLVTTDPIKDCAGNAVPDGTIVTFTQTDGSGRSTVDSRIKKGIAQAELPNSPGSTLTVASGVVMGNEIHWGGK